MAWRMILFDHDELSFGNWITENGIELGMTEKASLRIVGWFFYFLKGGFHFSDALTKNWNYKDN